MISSTLINWSICFLSDTCLDSKIPENSEKCPSQFLNLACLVDCQENSEQNQEHTVSCHRKWIKAATAHIWQAHTSGSINDKDE